MSTDDKNPSNQSPELDKAKSEAIIWTIRPKDDQDIKTFSHIQPGSAFILASITQIHDYIEQLLESKMTFECSKCNEYHEETAVEETCELTSKIGYIIDKTVTNSQIKELVDDILLTSVSQGGKRALAIIEMLKNMSRPSGLGGLMSMFRGQSDEEDATQIDTNDQEQDDDY